MKARCAVLVSQIIKDKGDDVVTISPDESVGAAAALLRDNRIGAVIVLDNEGAVVGILSERDIVWGIASQGAAALDHPVSACMTSDVIHAQSTETLDQLLGRMTDRRVRHLPVQKDGRLCGIVSIGDLVKHKIGEVETEAQNLKQYIAAG
jgi:CBS domain-containing protein